MDALLDFLLAAMLGFLLCGWGLVAWVARGVVWGLLGRWRKHGFILLVDSFIVTAMVQSYTHDAGQLLTLMLSRTRARFAPVTQKPHYYHSYSL